jgi:1-acyl-sn-glycerol-3-phosphate acyltransferase
MSAYSIAGFITKILLESLAKIELIGQENIPPPGGYVVASNHLGRLDPALMFHTLNRPDFIIPVAEKYEHHPIFGPLGRAFGAVWLDRSNPSIHSLREMMQRMRRGEVLIIAPEGTRSKTEALQEGKPGVVFLASRAGIPIVPVAVYGTEDRMIMENIKHFRRSHIVGKAGKPFTLAPIKGGQDREKALQEQTDELMCRIAVLLPEKYRGVYAQHPRLKELLENDDA